MLSLIKIILYERKPESNTTHKLRSKGLVHSIHKKNFVVLDSPNKLIDLGYFQLIILSKIFVNDYEVWLV